MDLNWKIPEFFFHYQTIEVDISKSVSNSFRKVLTNLNSKLESIIFIKLLKQLQTIRNTWNARKFPTFQSADYHTGQCVYSNSLQKSHFCGFWGISRHFRHEKKFLHRNLRHFLLVKKYLFIILPKFFSQFELPPFFWPVCLFLFPQEFWAQTKSPGEIKKVNRVILQN